jgi:hypothetical protein
MAGFAKVWLQSVAGCSKYGCAGKVQKCGCIVYVWLGAAKVWLHKLSLLLGCESLAAKCGCWLHEVWLGSKSVAEHSMAAKSVAAGCTRYGRSAKVPLSMQCSGVQRSSVHSSASQCSAVATSQCSAIQRCSAVQRSSLK